MKIINKKKLTALLLVVLLQFVFMPAPKAYAATDPGLGAAGGFSALGSSAVTNTGTTTLSGDEGVSPGTSLTNGGTLNVGGAVHNNDATAIQAHSDAGIANGVLLAQGSTGSIGPALDNLNLTTGVYDIGAGRLNGGILTLNGPGVYIFRASSDFVSSGSISLTNGARACDVYWDVNTQATINGTSFVGTILAGSGVVFGAGVSLNGRALVFGGTGPVTMIGDTITGPTCGAAASSSSSSSGGAPASPFCPTISATVAAPIILESRRVSPTSIFLSWGPFSGVNTFNLQYGTTNGNWLYNTDVTGFSTTLNALPTNQPIWVRIAARSSCTIGTYGVPTLVGGPGLPNTGLAPREDNFPWYIPVGILVGIFVLRFSSRHASLL